MRKELTSINSFLVILIMAASLLSQETTDRLSGKNQKIHYSVKAEAPFEIVIEAEMFSKGQITFIYEKFSFSQPFELEKGGTARYGVNPSDKIKNIIIDLYEGSILINHGANLATSTKMPKSSLKETQPAPALAASFTADTVMNIQGQIVRGKVHLKNHMYRYDLIVEPKKMVKTKDELKTSITDLTVQTTVEMKNISAIVDKKTGKEILIDHDEKCYYEEPGVSALYNPIEGHYMMSTLYQVIDKGTEDIGQISCERKDLMDGETLVQTAWISKKYHFPVKIINYIQGKEQMIFELKNIKETTVDPKIFEIPEGYKKKEL